MVITMHNRKDTTQQPFVLCNFRSLCLAQLGLMAVQQAVRQNTSRFLKKLKFTLGNFLLCSTIKQHYLIVGNIGGVKLGGLAFASPRFFCFASVFLLRLSFFASPQFYPPKFYTSQKSQKKIAC